MNAETAWIEDCGNGAAATLKKFANDWGDLLIIAPIRFRQMVIAHQKIYQRIEIN